MSDQNLNARSDESPDRIMAMHQSVMREQEEPTDGLTSSPVLFLLGCFALAGWGGYYIGTNTGNWEGNVFNEKIGSGGSAATAPAAPQDPMVLGKELFGNCMQCHKETGLGLPGEFPPLVASEFVTGDPRRLTGILLRGLKGELTVNGAKYNGEMPPWRDAFNDEEIAAIATFIRNSWGNKAPPVSKDLVAATRKELAEQSGSWVAETLAAWAAKPAPVPAPAAPAPTAAAPAPATK